MAVTVITRNESFALLELTLPGRIAEKPKVHWELLTDEELSDFNEGLRKYSKTYEVKILAHN